MELKTRCGDLLEELELGTVADITECRPLTGGVASDIAMVALGERRMCMKFALPKLKVEADWCAPVHRNAAEYAWLQVASRFRPESAVKLYGQSKGQHGFAMEFIDGDDVYLWKTNLLTETPVRQEAKQVANMLGHIQTVSARQDFDAAAFQNRDDFRALRIEPYLNYTAKQHRDLKTSLDELADRLYESTEVLVHGDASPKNILFRSGGPVILDAECATMGDASFDPSFCLNHLVLKAIHLPASRNLLMNEVTDFWEAYRQHVTWEKLEHLEARICRLLPALMLARVDGKSPVEYLNENERSKVRKLSIQLIKEPPIDITDLIERLQIQSKEEKND